MQKIGRIAITGPTGAVGIAIIKQMIAQNVEVLAICNPQSHRNKHIPDNPLVKLIPCDLSHLNELTKQTLPPCDIFYHLGWGGTIGNGRNDMRLQTQNIMNSLNAVELAKHLECHTFIGAGSQAEYGRFNGVLQPETPVNPETGYGIAKLCAGKMTRIKCSQMGLRHIWIRILSVYGPYDGPDTLVMSMIDKLSAGIVPQTTPGEQLWDYLYSGDAANAFYLAGKCGKDGAVYCLGQGIAYPLKDYIMTIREITAPEMDVAIGAIPYSSNQVMHLCADISALQNDTGFAPATSFSDGIRKTLLWYNKERGDVK